MYLQLPKWDNMSYKKKREREIISIKLIIPISIKQIVIKYTFTCVGDLTGSQKACHVMYILESHWFVPFPPRPITDFSQYTKALFILQNRWNVTCDFSNSVFFLRKKKEKIVLLYHPRSKIACEASNCWHVYGPFSFIRAQLSFSSIFQII